MAVPTMNKIKKNKCRKLVLQVGLDRPSPALALNNMIVGKKKKIVISAMVCESKQYFSSAELP